MAQYTVRLYFETGFNSINIPDSPELLNGNEQTIPPTTEFSYLDFPSLDINQERFLPMVRIRASWDVIKNADYCRIGTWYYFVDGIRMSSGDVAELTLVPDFITSAGGVSQLQILDGVTDRVHITDDSFGLYGEEDPYMSPAYDMDIDSYTHTWNQASYTFVETTLNLKTLGLQKRSNNTEASVASCTKDGTTFNVTYPSVPMLNGTTHYDTGTGTTYFNLTDIKGQGLYLLGGDSDMPSNIVRDGMAQARALGVEESISGQFSIPSVFVDPSGDGTGEFVTKLRGLSGSIQASSVPFIYGNARNNRVFYGSQSPYTLATAAGDTLTAKAEEIYGAGMTGPAVSMMVDPRRTGKPYYRFTVLNGKSAGNDIYDFFRGCVAGEPWQSVPLVFNNKSGSVLDQVSHRASMAQRDIKELEAQIQYDRSNSAWSKIKKIAPAAIGLGAAIISGGTAAIVGGVAGGALSVGGSIADDVHKKTDYERMADAMAIDRAIEEQQFAISQTAFVPTIAFPADPALFSEITRNGFGVYRAVYKPQDITRIDRILTAYGYKYTKILEPTDFTNRRDFNYIKASITVGNLPMWWANGIAVQLSGGVRVWHKRPNPAYYTQNPVAI